MLFRPTLTPRRRLAYALGSPGFVISDRIVVAIAFYYYLPPSGRGLEPLLSQELFLGVLTAWGLSRLIGGAFDSVADPLQDDAAKKATHGPLPRTTGQTDAGRGEHQRNAHQVQPLVGPVLMPLEVVLRKTPQQRPTSRDERSICRHWRELSSVVAE